MDYNPPGSPVHEIFQAWILEWIVISFSSRLIRYSPLIASVILLLLSKMTREKSAILDGTAAAAAKSLQSCPTLRHLDRTSDITLFLLSMGKQRCERPTYSCQSSVSSTIPLGLSILKMPLPFPHPPTHYSHVITEMISD